MIESNKILFLLHLPPPVHGSSIVGQKIMDSVLINSSFNTKYINLLISRKVEESGKTKLSKLFRFIVSWFKLLIVLVGNKPNLCYFALTTTGSGFYKDVSLVLLLKFFRVKIVFHLHNKGIKKNKSKGINNALYKYVFKKSSVILLSNYLYDDVKTYVTSEQVHICPNGVEDLIKSNNSKSKLKIKSNRIKILFLSNLIESKGVFVLIKACKILQERGYDFLCDFVGGEGDVDAQQFKTEVEKAEIAERVQYLGKKHGFEKNEAYKSADIFVLPTNNDCFPLVLLEAMQHSLPIISTIEGGIRDIVEDKVTGFLVDQNNPTELADKLATLIDNEAMRLEMGSAGYAKYKKEFTLQAFESKLQGILEHILLKDIEKNNK